MEEPPPNEQPKNEPPQQFAQYYRGGTSQFHGSPAKLRALADGYFGLNNIFALNVLIVLVGNVVIGAVTASGASLEGGRLAAYLIGLIALGLIVGFLAYPYNKKIGEGASWQPKGAVIASVLIGLNSAICCGVIGFVVVQHLAYIKMKAFGVRSKGFGLNKKDVEHAIQELQRQEALRQPPTFPPPPIV